MLTPAHSKAKNKLTTSYMTESMSAILTVQTDVLKLRSSMQLTWEKCMLTVLCNGPCDNYDLTAMKHTIAITNTC